MSTGTMTLLSALPACRVATLVCPDTSARALVRVCRNLKLNAMSMGNFADAGHLTYLEKTYERRGFWRDKAWGRWAGSLALSALWGYGEKPWRLALVMAFNIAFFGTLLNWVDPLPGKSWWEHVYFSAITYLTVGYGDLAPHSPLDRAGQAGLSGVTRILAPVSRSAENRPHKACRLERRAESESRSGRCRSAGPWR